MGRGDLTNKEWRRPEPHLPEGGRRGGRWASLHSVIDSYVSSNDAAVAIAAARAGADVVRTMYGQRLARIDKGAGDFATAADVESEKAILDVIRAA